MPIIKHRTALQCVMRRADTRGLAKNVLDIDHLVHGTTGTVQVSGLKRRVRLVLTWERADAGACMPAAIGDPVRRCSGLSHTWGSRRFCRASCRRASKDCKHARYAAFHTGISPLRHHAKHTSARRRTQASLVRELQGLVLLAQRNGLRHQHSRASHCRVTVFVLVRVRIKYAYA